jgi:hypothetical protein
LRGKDCREEKVLQIAMLSRGDLKQAIRQDQIEESYLMMIKVIKDPEKNEESGKEPGWIDKEYDSMFLDGLPAEMPPTQAVDHQIPLLPDMPPPFKGIF